MNRNFIAPGAKIIGDVQLGDHVGIWYNAVVRGDSNQITVGECSNVQDNCTIHTSTDFAVQIGKNVSIGHNAVIHGCQIDDNTIVGMGSVVLNGAHIGKNCIIGAGTVVTGNKVIPDGTLAFGNPARVVRSLSEEEIAHNLLNAKNYVKMGFPEVE